MLLVLLASFVGSFGAVFLKAGAKKLRDGFRHLLFNPAIVAGVISFLVSSYFFVLGIRHGELSILYPLVSLSYVWTLLWSRLFFHEPFTRNKFLGLFVILVGVFFIGLGNQ